MISSALYMIVYFDQMVFLLFSSIFILKYVSCINIIIEKEKTFCMNVLTGQEVIFSKLHR